MSTNWTLQENKNRFVIFPIKHHDIWNGIRRWRLVFDCWRNRSQDLNDWNNKLNDDEDISWSTFLLFCSFWRIVNENLAENFVNEVQYAEAKILLWFSNNDGEYS
jgi:ribonucleoside-diphosphate reductase beta chain